MSLSARALRQALYELSYPASEPLLHSPARPEATVGSEFHHLNETDEFTPPRSPSQYSLTARPPGPTSGAPVNPYAEIVQKRRILAERAAEASIGTNTKIAYDSPTSQAARLLQARMADQEALIWQQPKLIFDLDLIRYDVLALRPAKRMTASNRSVAASVGISAAL